MKSIGLIGGMSWESTAEYYRIINEEVSKRLGKTHSAKIWLHSFDFEVINELQHSGRWDELTELMVDAGRKLEVAGASVVAICTNTMHRLAPAMEREFGVPLLHIGDATGEAVRRIGFDTVGLLGTEFTMTGDFLKKRLYDRYGIEVIIPGADGRKKVHDVIYDELVIGRFMDSSRKEFLGIIDELVSRGARGVILGCTEIPLLVRKKDTDVPLFDTTSIHAMAIAEFALRE